MRCSVTEKKKAGFWDLTKDVAKGIGVNLESISEGLKVEAHKSTLEHIEKIKKLEKRAKDAGISEEDLAKLKKDYGFTQRESEVSASALDSIRITAARGLDLEFEKRFEQHLESIEKAQEMARNWKPKK